MYDVPDHATLKTNKPLNYTDNKEYRVSMIFRIGHFMFVVACPPHYLP